MQSSRLRFSLRPVLILGVGFLPVLCALIALGFALLGVRSGGSVLISRTVLLTYSLLGLLFALPGVTLLFVLLRGRRSPDARIEVLAAGLEPGDYALIQKLFPNSADVRLAPLTGGYSGATVLRAQSWGLGATLQRASVVKIGSAAKLQPEVDNFERYVREYVGNTAALQHVAQRGGRMAIRWAYAAFIGERVQTLADYAATGAPLVPVIEELFSSRSTLGLLLGSARRDPQFALYREYSWTPRDWQRIVQASHEILGNEPLQPQLPFAADAPNPLAAVVRWWDPLSGSGERGDLLFDVPIATIHGDLNSRNILIDERGSIFVIDFAHAGPGHLLRDFARLETELLLVLGQPEDEAGIAARVAQARFFLTNNDQPRQTLRDILQPRPSSDQRGAAIVALRRQAHDLAGPWLNTPSTPYLLALLHTTLDTLRYAQCTPPTKRAALLIASRLCQLLA